MKPKRIIVADIYKDSRDMFSQYLRIKGCDVKPTSDVESFNNALKDHPEIIIINSPISDFIEVLRKKPRDDLPKLFLLSRDRFSKQEKQILMDELNTVDILTLPFNLDEFEKKIKILIK
jgi:DNA-binding response OmpR family regulator